MKSLLLLLYLMVPPTEGSLCKPYEKDFDGYRYPEKVVHCKRNVATYRKEDICRRDGVFDRRDFTVDHIIPLALGGSNRDDNLWCQHQSLSVTSTEYRLYRLLRDGHLTQEESISLVLNKKFDPKL